MSEARTTTPAKRLGSMSVIILVFAFLTALTAPFAGAQVPPAEAVAGTPSIAVDAFAYDVGDTLHLSGQNLAPNETYTVSLIPPEDSQEEEVSLDVSTNIRGGLNVDALLRNPGTYMVSLSGPRIDARLTVQVNGAEQQGGAAAPFEDPPGGPLSEPAEPAGPSADQDEDEQAGPAERPQDEEPDASAELPEEQPDEQPEEQPDEAGGPAEEGAEDGAEPSDEQGDQQGPDPDADPEDDSEAEDGVAADAAGPGDAGRPEVRISNDTVVAERGGTEAWRLEFGPNSGGTDGLLELEESVLVGHGNHVLALDPVSGTVTDRYRMPAKVVSLERSPGGDDQRVSVTVAFGTGTTTVVPLPTAEQANHAFDTDPEVYGWLRAEADVSDPEAQLASDQTNPWLYLATAEAQPQRLLALRRNALARADTFYEYAQLANAFLAEPDRDLELAAQAMDAALDDFAARGYRGAMLFDEQASEAYGFPASSMRDALARGDDEAADFWAPWLYRLSNDAVPAKRDLLVAYAEDLRSRGRVQEASTWDQRARGESRFAIGPTLERTARALGNTGWYGVLALLVAILALHVTLAAKYWQAQTAHLTARAATGRESGPAARLFTLRYATITEKIVMLLLFAAVMALAALAGWAETSDEIPAGLGYGSLATATSREAIEENLPDGPERTFLLGYAAQTAGDEGSAANLYRELSDHPDAMNNLGALRSDDELFRVALELEPRHPEASFNLGLSENPSRLMAAYRPEETLLAAPSRESLMRAAGGDYRRALGNAFTNPWASLTELRALQPQWLWIALVVLFLLWVLWTVITLLIPRPAAARDARRSFLYHLLALLLPGSGLADELVGVLLLVPWAIFGIDTLIHFFAFNADPTFPLRTDLVVLAVIYLLNTIAFIVEYTAYRRRLRDVRAAPTVATREYGLSDVDG